MSREAGPQLPLMTAPRWYPFVVAAFAILAACLRLRVLVNNPPLHFDEVWLAVNLLDCPYSDLFRPLKLSQTAPPGFLVLVKGLTQLCGRSEWVLRLLPWAAGVATVPFGCVLGERLSGWRVGLLTAWLLAIFNPQIYLSVFFKPYSLDALVAVVLMLLALGWTHGGLCRRLALLGAGLGAPWLSLPSVFVLAGIGTTLIAASFWNGARRSMAEMIGFSTAWGCSFGVLYLSALNSEHNRGFMVSFWMTEFAPLPPRSKADLQWLVNHFFEMFSSDVTMGLIWAGGLATFAALSGCVIIGRKRPVALGIIGVPLVVAFAASGLHTYPFYGRFLAFSIPALTALVATGVISLWNSDRTLGRIAIVLISIGPVWQAVGTLNHPDPKFLDFRGTQQFLSAHALPGDHMLLDDEGVIIPLEYYSPNRVLPVTTEQRARGSTFMKSEARSRVWVLLFGPARRGSYERDHQAEIVRLDQQARRVETYTTDGITLLLYVTK